MPSASCSLDIPPEIAASRLYAAGGFALIPGLFAEGVLAQLLAEALAVRSAGRRTAQAASDGTAGRGGCPGRAFRSAPGSPLQWQLFKAPSLIASLAQICSLAVTPLGGGSFTYYEQPGDFLALHRDIVTCDLAVITCLDTTGAAPGGGGLLVYPGCMTEPLSTVRAAGRVAGTPAPLGRGDTIALLGGIVPHEVAPMEAGQERIVSVMCYRVLPPDASASRDLSLDS